MRKRLLLAGFVAGVLAFPNTAQAQAAAFVGVGPTVPIGDFNKDKSPSGEKGSVGGQVSVGLGYGIQSVPGLFVFGEGFFGINNHPQKFRETHTTKTYPYGAFGGLGYRIGDPARPGFYVLGYGGLLANHVRSTQFEPITKTQAAYGAGVGWEVPAGRVSWYIEARYTGSRDLSFFPVLTGVTIPFSQR
jgi:hypothetical protein